jgi:predicted HicB family RNase H-like nuclease
MRYKGFEAAATFDAEADLFHGEISGIRDVVTIQGRTTAELEIAFKESVEDYLEFCRDMSHEARQSGPVVTGS